MRPQVRDLLPRPFNEASKAARVALNYKKIYDQIIENARSADRDKSLGYFEKHHIIPRSLGGSNEKSNLVLLTPREHFLCHALLCKIFEVNTSNRKKMLHAFILMKGMHAKQFRYINARIYDSIKKEYAVVRSLSAKGKMLTEAHKKKISKSLKGHKFSDETKRLISEKAKQRVRKPFDDEYKKRMSVIMKEVKRRVS